MADVEELYTQRRRLLAQVGAALSELGCPAGFAEGLPDPVLLADLGTDAAGRARQCSWMFVPLEAGADFDYLGLVQVYSELPLSRAAVEQPDLARKVLALNNEIPAGSLGIGPSGAVYYRWVLPVEKWRALEAPALQQLYLVLVYILAGATEHLDGTVAGLTAG